jgi:hypothetical protein
VYGDNSLLSHPVLELTEVTDTDRTGDTRGESNCALESMHPFSGAVMAWSGITASGKINP